MILFKSVSVYFPYDFRSTSLCFSNAVFIFSAYTFSAPSTASLTKLSHSGNTSKQTCKQEQRQA